MLGLVVFVSALLVIFAVSLNTVRIGVKLKVRVGFTLIKLNIGILGGLIPIRFNFRAVYSRGEGLYIARIYGNGRLKKIWYPGKPKKKSKVKILPLILSLIQETDFQKIDLFSKIGVSDPFVTVFLCAFLNIVTNESLNTISVPEHKRAICVLPDFDKSDFILDLECIFRILITKIILNILKGNFKKGR